MFSTDEHGLTQPTAQQEQDWTEANDSPPEPDGPEPTDPAPSEAPSPAPAEPPENLPF